MKETPRLVSYFGDPLQGFPFLVEQELENNSTQEISCIKGDPSPTKIPKLQFKSQIPIKPTNSKVPSRKKPTKKSELPQAIVFCPDRNSTPTSPAYSTTYRTPTLENLLRKLDFCEAQNMKLLHELDACRRAREGLIKERYYLIGKANGLEKKVLELKQSNRHKVQETKSYKRVAAELEHRNEALRLASKARELAEANADKYYLKYQELLQKQELQKSVSLPVL